MMRHTTASGSIYETDGLKIRRLMLGKKHEERGSVAKRNADPLGSGEWVEPETFMVTGQGIFIKFHDGTKLRTNAVVKTEEI